MSSKRNSMLLPSTSNNTDTTRPSSRKSLLNPNAPQGASASSPSTNAATTTLAARMASLAHKRPLDSLQRGSLSATAQKINTKPVISPEAYANMSLAARMAILAPKKPVGATITGSTSAIAPRKRHDLMAVTIHYVAKVEKQGRKVDEEFKYVVNIPKIATLVDLKIEFARIYIEKGPFSFANNKSYNVTWNENKCVHEFTETSGKRLFLRLERGTRMFKMPKSTEWNIIKSEAKF
ncbi:hypothetical protein LPJ66_005373 [Kickxella alabastrina]|uniref:Uncharacterized protein n=1 Tax=Kickxella alabastrina TaxID=61397 RepID=A0ACC1IH35_9FUNG|nr:hypothetical protein LPJ66_005373 [Kickxella alabastrina]